MLAAVFLVIVVPTNGRPAIAALSEEPQEIALALDTTGFRPIALRGMSAPLNHLRDLYRFTAPDYCSYLQIECSAGVDFTNFQHLFLEGTGDPIDWPALIQAFFNDRYNESIEFVDPQSHGQDVWRWLGFPDPGEGAIDIGTYHVDRSTLQEIDSIVSQLRQDNSDRRMPNNSVLWFKSTNSAFYVFKATVFIDLFWQETLIIMSGQFKSDREDSILFSSLLGNVTWFNQQGKTTQQGILEFTQASRELLLDKAADRALSEMFRTMQEIMPHESGFILVPEAPIGLPQSYRLFGIGGKELSVDSAKLENFVEGIGALDKSPKIAWHFHPRLIEYPICEYDSGIPFFCDDFIPSLGDQYSDIINTYQHPSIVANGIFSTDGSFLLKTPVYFQQNGAAVLGEYGPWQLNAGFFVRHMCAVAGTDVSPFSYKLGPVGEGGFRIKQENFLGINVAAVILATHHGGVAVHIGKIGEGSAKLVFPEFDAIKHGLDYKVRIEDLSNLEDFEIAFVQYLLKKNGYYDGKVDGKYGPRTARAMETVSESARKYYPSSEYSHFYGLAVLVLQSIIQQSIHDAGMNLVKMEGKENNWIQKTVMSIQRMECPDVGFHFIE